MLWGEFFSSAFGYPDNAVYWVTFLKNSGLGVPMSVIKKVIFCTKNLHGELRYKIWLYVGLQSLLCCGHWV